MEAGVIAVIILVVLVGGTLALLTRQGMVPWTIPALRASSAGAAMPVDELSVAERDRDSGEETPLERGQLGPRADARSGVAPSLGLERGEPRLLEPFRYDVAPALPLALVERLDQIETRLDALQRANERQDAELGRLRVELQASLSASEAHHQAAMDRLRGDLLAAIRSSVVEGQNRLADRRADVSADLYARLARLESALASVTNPILLPGEEYAPPAELMPEALIWENWNEVGERAFALADAYSAQRLSLSDEARHQMGHFITALRLLLTRSVYPNLQTDPDAAQQAALHDALVEIADELPKVRASLDREYRDEAGS